MTRIGVYIKRLEQTYSGGNWLAESFQGKLSHLAAQTVFTPPLLGVHSVAEIVWHCIYWRLVTLERLKGNAAYRDQTIQELNFLSVEVLRSKGWSVLLQELKETQEELISLLRINDDSFLSGEYQPGYSFDYLINGLIEHDVYHLGQIGLVIKILDVKKSQDTFRVG